MYPGHHAQRDPERPALRLARSGHTLSYGELDARSNQGAHLLRRLGLAPGDAIAFCLENHPRFFELVWAAQRSGLRYTAISSRLTPPEVEYIVRDCGAKVFVSSAAKAELCEALEQPLRDLRARFWIEGGQRGWGDWAGECSALPRDPIDDECEGSDMLYSSGTTGRPKGVRFLGGTKPIGSPNALVMLMQKLYGVDTTSRYLSPAPLYHAAPLRFSLAVQRIGGTCVVLEEFDARFALETLQRERITHSQWVPTMFVRMLKLPAEERARYDLSSLRVAIHASAPCPIPIKEQMIEWWGPILYEYYAGTEANGFTSIDSHEWLRHKGSVGRSLTAKIRIVDDEGRDLPTGEAGAIYFEGSTAFEYHNDPQKTAETRSAAGGSTLGDIGYLDEEGYLYLTDRKAHMIISGGVNIYPQEAENLLATHPKVLDVAVIGIPNEDFGEEVKAVVQPVDMALAGPDLERELIEFCRAQLSSIKCPRSVDFEAELPRHPTGKLYKRLLRDRYWQNRASRII